jgi:radical SAM superfamily enzyme YgiQ (UPF0313 family)
MIVRADGIKSVLASPPYGLLFGLPYGTPVINEPLGLEYVAANAIANGVDCEVLPDLPLDPHKAAVKLVGTGASVFGLGVATPALPWLVRMVKALRDLKPGAKVIIGGDHPSAIGELALDEEAIDYAVAGEGEAAFVGLLQVLAKRRHPRDIPGLIWRDGSERKIIANAREIIANLDDLPLPVRDNAVLGACRIDGLIYPSPSQQRAVAQVMHSRGCTNACSFCSSRLVFGNGIRFRSASRVVKEIEQLVKCHDVNLLFFADLHLGASAHRIEELCGQLALSRAKVSWYACMTVASMTANTAEKMFAANCCKVALGVESMHPTTHRRLHVGSTVENVKSAVQASDTAGLLVRAYYMVGIPGENSINFRVGIEALCQLPVDEVRIAFFTIFPGTPAYRKYKSFLLTSNISDLTSTKPLLDLPGYPAEQQMTDYEWAIRRFYEGSEYAARWRNKVRRFPRYEQSYAEFFAFLKQRGINVR